MAQATYPTTFCKDGHSPLIRQDGPAPLRIMSDDEALASLLAQPGRLETSQRALARQWGWGDTEAGRVTVGRRLARWEADGLLARESKPGGRTVILIGQVRANTVTNNVMNISLVHPVQPPTPSLPSPACGGGSFALFSPVHFGVHHLAAAALAALAVFIAWTVLNIDASFGRSFGRTQEAADLFGRLSWGSEALALVLPAAARALWQCGRRGCAALAWALAAVTMPVALLAFVGFASTNIADTTAGRGKVAVEARMLTAQVEKLTLDRAAIRETRAATTIAAEIQAAQSQPAAAAVWGITRGCTDVTRPASGEACRALLVLRQALGEAERRDTIDAGIKEAQERLAALPGVAAADPQAEMAAKLITWLSAGTLTVRPADIDMIRILGMMVLSVTGGLVLMVATGLWSGARREG